MRVFLIIEIARLNVPLQQLRRGDMQEHLKTPR
jgi:hypothetical protein